MLHHPFALYCDDMVARRQGTEREKEIKRERERESPGRIVRCDAQLEQRSFYSCIQQ